VRRDLVSPYVSFAFLACVFCTWYGSFVSSDRPDVGAQIRKAREALRISQVELSLRLDCGERSVQAWERNERTPRLDALTSISRVLGQPVAYFYGDGEPDGNDAPVAA
jgi:DNA-binding XRE family transcriptional regulator